MPRWKGTNMIADYFLQLNTKLNNQKMKIIYFQMGLQKPNQANLQTLW